MWLGFPTLRLIFGSRVEHRGGGGGALPYWRWRGRAAGQGMILRSSILAQTDYLNRPNWLLAGYSVYHRVASQGFTAHNVYDRPAISATVQYCDRVCIWTFLVRYIVTGCNFLCAPSGLRHQGQVFDPPAAPPRPHESRVPLPPPPRELSGYFSSRSLYLTLP